MNATMMLMLVLAQRRPPEAESLGWIWLPIALLAIVVLVVIFIIVQYGNLWIQCYMTQTPITFLDLIGMSLRKVNARLIVNAQVMATKSGLRLDTGKLEAHYLAGGDVLGVVRVLIAARRAGLDWDFDRIAAMNLAKEDMDALLDEIRSRAAASGTSDDAGQTES